MTEREQVRKFATHGELTAATAEAKDFASTLFRRAEARVIEIEAERTVDKRALAERDQQLANGAALQALIAEVGEAVARYETRTGLKVRHVVVQHNGNVLNVVPTVCNHA